MSLCKFKVKNPVGCKAMENCLFEALLLRASCSYCLTLALDFHNLFLKEMQPVGYVRSKVKVSAFTLKKDHRKLHVEEKESKCHIFFLLSIFNFLLQHEASCGLVNNRVVRPNGHLSLLLTPMFNSSHISKGLRV